MKHTLQRFAILAALLAGLATTTYAQQTVATTTTTAAISAPLTGQGTSGSNTAIGPQNTFTVASTSNISVGYEIFVDQEAMLVTAIPVSGTVVVQRAYDTTRVASHNSGATVYIGASSAVPGSPFQYVDPPVGTCTLTNELWSLRINVTSGDIWACTGGQWMNVIDSYVVLPASACVSSVSGNGTGTNGLTTAGTSGMPVMQAQTSATGTNTHTYVCNLPVPTRTNVGKGSYVLDVSAIYGVQQAALGTQTATLASGTMNSTTVFGTVATPAAAASETASTVAPVRWDSGTLTITPAVASFNGGTTTAGAFFTSKFIPASPLAMVTDGTSYVFSMTLQAAATTATTTNVAGLIVHYRTVTGL